MHVKATIVKVYPDRERRGAMHQHFDVVAIRYGDHMGLAEPISGIAEGQEIELQGEYIDHGHAYATEDNRDRSPVIHFTHRPVGYVIYQGKEYH
ncbi:hypothetical protein [Paenibacillus alvei]|uniref:hypothetical protein n=1 Tax=Paenibacillus alvei TaxID=44250 RepID=UPI0030B9A0E8